MPDIYAKSVLTIIALLLAGILVERLWRGGMPPQIEVTEPCGKSSQDPCFVTVMDADGRPARPVDPEKHCGDYSDPCYVKLKEEPPFGSGGAVAPLGSPLNPVRPPAGQGGLRPPPRP